MEKKRKKIEAELQLPEAIIQHIQSFLDGREAARTTILSESWYAAWLTRPNLDFHQGDFVLKSGYDNKSASRLWRFAKKTVERYGKLNLKIHSLRLSIYGSNDATHYSNSYANRLILKALRMGATDLDFKILDQNYGLPFVLSDEVFGSKNLIKLSVSGCKICFGADEKVISCSRLKSLTLEKVDVEGDIISNCPLIENMSLSATNYIFPEVGKRNVGYEFQKLKCLLLFGSDVHSLFLDDFSCKFPCLKNLALHRCKGYKVIQISSPSLECISFTQDEKLMAKFDVPNIRKFTFSGLSIPSLSFKPTMTSNWESEISIKRRSYLSSKWFRELNILLKKLSVSKVSLSLEALSEQSLDWAGRIQGLPKPEVENLSINVPCSVCPALLYALFSCCHPIYITQCWFPKAYGGGEKTYNFMDFVFKMMMPQVTLSSCIAYQRKSGESDLKEVNVEFYDESVSAWRPRPQPLLFGASASLGDNEHRTRVHLRWGR